MICLFARVYTHRLTGVVFHGCQWWVAKLPALSRNPKYSYTTPISKYISFFWYLQQLFTSLNSIFRCKTFKLHSDISEQNYAVTSEAKIPIMDARNFWLMFVRRKKIIFSISEKRWQFLPQDNAKVSHAQLFLSITTVNTRLRKNFCSHGVLATNCSRRVAFSVLMQSGKRFLNKQKTK